jgi:hypothetical protein
MYWVEISGNKITGKGQSPTITEEQIEISENIYNQLTRLPADYVTDGEGNIISVTPAPEPEPEPQTPKTPTVEERISALEDALTLLLMEV